MVAALTDAAFSDDSWFGDDRGFADDSGPADHGCVDGRWRENRSVDSAVDRGLIGELPPRLRPRPRAARSPSVPSPAVIRRRRLVAGGVAATILLGLLLGLQALFGLPGGGPLASVGPPPAAQPPAGRIWVVRPGDTLWSIALGSGAQGDIRPLVARLSAEVGGRPLQPGERIRVP